MANSRGRRTLRRMLQEAGLHPPPATPAIIPRPKPISLRKRIPRWVYLVLGLFALVITLLEGYPWLSIQDNGSLNPRDPFTAMFSVSNGGYIPLTNLDADCVFGAVADPLPLHDLRLEGNSMPVHNFASWLWHDDRATLPCFHILRERIGPNLYNFKNPTLEITVLYSFVGLNLKPLRRSQTFLFRAAIASDNSWRWLFLH
jgi:hypothetical protein